MEDRVENIDKVIDVKINETLEDYRNLINYHRRKITIFLPIIYFVCILLTPILMNINEIVDLVDIYALVIITLPIALIATLAIILFNYFFIKIRTKSSFKSNKLINQEQHVTVMKSGFTRKSESYSVKVKWDEVHFVEESKNILAVFIDNNSAVILPKRYLNDVEIDTFKEIVEENLSAKKYKWTKTKR